MAEAKKRRMGYDRFVEIFGQYSFIEQGEVLDVLKKIYKEHGKKLCDKLQNDLKDIETKIS